MGLEFRFRGQMDPDCVWGMTAEVEGIATRCGWDFFVLEAGGIGQKEYVFLHPDAKVPHHNLVMTPPYRGIVVRTDPESDWFPVLTDPKGLLHAMDSSLELKSEQPNDDSWWVSYRREFFQVADHLLFIELMKFLRREYIDRLDLVDVNQMWDTQTESLGALHDRVLSVLNRMEPHFAGTATILGQKPNFPHIAEETEEAMREIWRKAS